jgi:arylformamidase
MRSLVCTVVVLIPSFVVAAELKINRDLAYANSQESRQTLDLYAPQGAKDCPVIVWIHGGGWRRGDKAPMLHKPQALADKGFVFASINYRFVPEVTIKQMMGDVAKAIRWVHEHAREYGGDPSSIYVMGHSAGAHLAALVSTDDRYLKAEGLSLAILKGCVPVDVAAFDIVKRLEEKPDPTGNFLAVFGKTSDEQRDLSPITHVAKGKQIPPFLILYVADRPETKSQSHHLAKALEAAGVPATVVAGEGKTHGTINTELGLPDDKPTQALFEFLGRPVKQSPQRRI